MTFKNKITEIDTLQKEINAYRPLNKHYTSELKEYFRIGLTWSSNAIEGNTLSESETRIIIEDGLTIGGKTVREHQEALGHSDAFDFIYDLTTQKKITEKDILDIHRLFYFRIDNENAGQYRKVNISVRGSEYTFPLFKTVPRLMEKFTAAIPELRKKNHPVEFAALLHKKLVEIHPFIDGNGRAARLLMNLALLQEEYVITVIPAVVRGEYFNCLEAAHNGNNTPFINFISSMVYESQKDYLRMIKNLDIEKKE
ncbi:MAG: Fic family protein [bacterium]|nr:Fic family protein [bacterium]